MNIGFLGLGKLGLPVSLAVEDKGHNVFGYDISKQTIDDIKKNAVIVASFVYHTAMLDKPLPRKKNK